MSRHFQTHMASEAETPRSPCAGTRLDLLAYAGHLLEALDPELNGKTS